MAACPDEDSLSFTSQSVKQTEQRHESGPDTGERMITEFPPRLPTPLERRKGGDRPIGDNVHAPCRKFA